MRKRIGPTQSKDENNPEQPQVENAEEPTKDTENTNININHNFTSNLPIQQEIQPTEKSAEAKKKIRCKKWPMCKNEACEYAHPKETVRI